MAWLICRRPIARPLPIMAPGIRCYLRAFFPVDGRNLRYLRLTGRRTTCRTRSRRTARPPTKGLCVSAGA